MARGLKLTFSMKNTDNEEIIQAINISLARKLLPHDMGRITASTEKEKVKSHANYVRVSFVNS